MTTMPDRRQQLLVFFSADLANSTDFKARNQGQHQGDEFIPARWPQYFSEVFSRILGRFGDEQRKRRTGVLDLLTCPRLWKINGDELVFREIVLPGEDGLRWLAQTTASFIATVEAVDNEILPDGLGLKACVWTAGFPIRNKEIRVPSIQNVPVVRVAPQEASLPDFDTGLLPRDDQGLVDYIGPDMDLGFRLAATAQPGRVVCSLDAGYLLTNRAESPHLHHVGWRVLQGVAGGSPYPILWLTQPGAGPTIRHPWEKESANPELQAFLRDRPLQSIEFRKLAEEYWHQLRDYFNRPYTSPADITENHLRIWSHIYQEEDAFNPYNPIILDNSRPS